MLGIIGAMKAEVAQLKQEMNQPEVVTVAGMEFYRGTIGEKEVVVVQSGIGKVSAALCVQILADRFGVDGVVNTGIAGSLKAEINIGDPNNMMAYTVSGIQIRLGDGEDLKSKADLTASMLKDLPKSQGNVQYIDVNPSSPFIKTDKVTVQPKSNKSKSDTSQSEKKDTSKQSANVSKSKQD